MATVPTQYEKVLRCDFCGVTHVEGSLSTVPQASVMDLLTLRHNDGCLLLSSIPNGGYFIPVSSGTEEEKDVLDGTRTVGKVTSHIFSIGVAVKRVNLP